MLALAVLPRALRLRQLQEWADNTGEANAFYVVFCILLVLFAGCMSGLTLGLLSLDILDLEVLRRSGTAQEQRFAKNIMPLVKNAHYLLVTLLLCNAAAMETLPIFLDKMVHESVAILVSVTAVLLFGEIIPQAVCSKHGLLIGSIMAYPVRFLMIVTAPISWPLSKLLDCVLGGDHASLFRRKQLKALVQVHSRDEGFGGKLTAGEIQIITGALDLTSKTAYHAMTPLNKVFMLSTAQTLDDQTIEAIMYAKPFSRVPVYRGHDKKDVVGLILVKELLEYVKRYPNSPVSSLKIRPLPRLSALTPMYDMLKLFRTGRAHMALLTQPLDPNASFAGSTTPHGAPVFTPRTKGQGAGAGVEASGGSSTMGTPGTGGTAGERVALLGVKGAAGRHGGSCSPAFGGARRYAAGSRQNSPGPQAAEAAGQYGGGGISCGECRGTGLVPSSAPASSNGSPRGPCGMAAGSSGDSSWGTATAHHGCQISGRPAAASSLAPAPVDPLMHHRGLEFADSASSLQLLPAPKHCPGCSAASSNDTLCHPPCGTAAAAPPPPPLVHLPLSGTTCDISVHSCVRPDAKGSFAFHVEQPPGGTGSALKGRPGATPSLGKLGAVADDASEGEDGDVGWAGPGPATLPGSAAPGEPLGIITLEDVIEELMQFEIVDETDRWVDNEQSVKVDEAGLDWDLSDSMKTVLHLAEATKAHFTASAPPPAAAGAGTAAAGGWDAPGAWPLASKPQHPPAAAAAAAMAVAAARAAAAGAPAHEEPADGLTLAPSIGAAVTACAAWPGAGDPGGGAAPPGYGTGPAAYQGDKGKHRPPVPRASPGLLSGLASVLGRGAGPEAAALPGAVAPVAAPGAAGAAGGAMGAALRRALSLGFKGGKDDGGGAHDRHEREMLLPLSVVAPPDEPEAGGGGGGSRPHVVYYLPPLPALPRDQDSRQRSFSTPTAGAVAAVGFENGPGEQVPLPGMPPAAGATARHFPSVDLSLPVMRRASAPPGTP